MPNDDNLRNLVMGKLLDEKKVPGQEEEKPESISPPAEQIVEKQEKLSEADEKEVKEALGKDIREDVMEGFFGIG